VAGPLEWTVEAGGQVFTFRRASFWRSEQELHVGGVKAGTIRRTSMWRGDVEADLPGLALPVQVFVVGVVIAMWEGEQTAAAAAASG
jgi:hypothetical protein